MAKKQKFKAPKSDRPVILKKGNQCIASFLGTSYKCTVVEVLDKYSYRLQYQDDNIGTKELLCPTILPYVTWGQLLTEYCPWYIVSKK